jgi:hypothetical protein
MKLRFVTSCTQYIISIYAFSFCGLQTETFTQNMHDLRLIAAEVPYLLVASSLQTQIREVKVIRATRVYFWRTLTCVLLFKPWGDWKGFRQSCHRICCMLCLPWDMETKLVSTLIPSDSSAASHISTSIHVEDPSLLEFSANFTDKYNVTNERREF